MSSQSRPALLPVIVLILSMACLQLGATFAKKLFPVLGAETTTSMRLMFSMLILCCIFRPWRICFTRKSWRTVVPYGVSLGVMNLSFYIGIQTIPLGIGVALEFLGPLALAVYWSRRLLDFIWVALAGLGVFFLVSADSSTEALDPNGVFFVLVAAVCWALYIIYGQKTGREHGSSVVAVGVGIAAMLTLPVGIYSAPVNPFTWQILPMGVALAVLSSAIPYGLEMYALRKVSAKHFGTLMSLEPVLGAIFGLTLLGEVLSFYQWIAIVAIVVASAGVTASRGT